MSGLAIWMNVPLVTSSYEENRQVFKIKEQEEKTFALNKITVIFRKYHEWHRESLSLNVHEKATLILESEA